MAKQDCPDLAELRLMADRLASLRMVLASFEATINSYARMMEEKLSAPARVWSVTIDPSGGDPVPKAAATKSKTAAKQAASKKPEKATAKKTAAAKPAAKKGAKGKGGR